MSEANSKNNSKNIEEVTEELERETARRKGLEDILRRDTELSRAFAMEELNMRQIYQRILLCTVHGKFNRGLLFRVFWTQERFAGVLGIGPSTAEDAGGVFERLRESSLEELLNQSLEDFLKSNAWINQLARSISIPLSDENGIVRAVEDGRTLRFLKRDGLSRKVVGHFRSADGIDVEEYAVSPLLIHGRAEYVLYVDNIFDKRPITKADKDYLEKLANTSSLAIYLTQLKNLDSLTRCHNNVSFKQALEQHIADGEEISVIAADLDTMKEINDEYGHAFGDDVLKGIADCIRRNAGPRSIVARLGGDEFAILLHNTYKDARTKWAERIRKALEELEFPVPGDKEGRKAKTTISLGVAPRGPDMLKEADKAMYRAKENGKNCVRGSLDPVKPK